MTKRFRVLALIRYEIDAETVEEAVQAVRDPADPDSQGVCVASRHVFPAFADGQPIWRQFRVVSKEEEDAEQGNLLDL